MASHHSSEPEAQPSPIASQTREEEVFRAAVRKGLEQADRGEFLEEEEMDMRFRQMLRGVRRR